MAPGLPKVILCCFKMYAILFCQMIKVHKLLLSSLFYKFHVSRSELLHYHLFSCGTQWPTKQSYGPNEWQKHTHFGWSHFRLVCLQTKMSQCMVLGCDVPLSLGHTVGCAGRGTPLVGCKSMEAYSLWGVLWFSGHLTVSWYQIILTGGKKNWENH